MDLSGWICLRMLVTSPTVQSITPYGKHANLPTTKMAHRCAGPVAMRGITSPHSSRQPVASHCQRNGCESERERKVKFHPTDTMFTDRDVHFRAGLFFSSRCVSAPTWNQNEATWTRFVNWEGTLPCLFLYFPFISLSNGIRIVGKAKAFTQFYFCRICQYFKCNGNL